MFDSNIIIMKKIYSLILAISLTNISFGQADYTISPQSDVQKAITPMAYDYLQIDLAHDNSTTDSVELNWEVIDINSPTPAQGWDYSYCDYVYCYTASATSGVMKKIGPNQTAFLKVNLLAPEEGWAYFQFKVWQTGQEASADTLSFTFHSTLGLSDVELGKETTIHPNPMNNSADVLKISNILPNSSVTIQNALGQTIYNGVSNSESMKIQDLNVRNGVYFVRLSRSGKTYATRKLIVQ